MADVKVLNMKMSTQEGSLKAFCQVEIAGKILIYGCKLLDGTNGLWVAMPQRKDQNDKYWDVVRITGESLKEKVTKAVIAAYEKATGGGEPEPEGGGGEF